MQSPRAGPFGKSDGVPVRADVVGADVVGPEPAAPAADERPAGSGADTTADEAVAWLSESADVAVQYMVADHTKHLVVRIYDRRTGETIRVIPPTLMVSTILKSLGVKSVSRLDRLV